MNDESTVNQRSPLDITREKIRDYRKTHARKALPTELMQEVMEHLKEFSLSHVAKSLGLNYKSLQKRWGKPSVKTQKERKRTANRKKVSPFVRLLSPAGDVNQSRVQIQMRSSSGQLIQLQVQSLAAEEWQNLFTGWVMTEQSLSARISP